MTPDEIRTALTAARTAQRRSMLDVANAAGTPSVSSISDWERGRMPRLDRAIAWANALGYDVVLVPREAP